MYHHKSVVSTLDELSPVATFKPQPSRRRSGRCREHGSSESGLITQLTYRRNTDHDVGGGNTKRAWKRAHSRRNSFSVPKAPQLLKSQYKLLMERHAFRNMLQEYIPSDSAVDDGEEPQLSAAMRCNFMVECINAKFDEVERRSHTKSPISEHEHSSDE